MRCVYQSLGTESRALLYQKFLLSDNIQNKLDLLFLLKDQFKKKIYQIFILNFYDRLEEINISEIPKDYLSTVERNIVSKKFKSTKIKFDDKVLHRLNSLDIFMKKIIQLKKPQKEFDSVYKR